MMRFEKQTARPSGWRPSIGVLLLAAFILVPLAEIAVLIEVGGWIGIGPTLALIVLTAVVGSWMLRRQGLAVLRRAQQQMQQAVLPVAEVFEGLCLLVAGALLLTPGFITDAMGALLLLPPVRSLLYRRLRHHLELRGMSGPGGPQDGRPGGPHGRGNGGSPPVIDAEFEEVDSEPMPEPRGSWDRRS